MEDENFLDDLNQQDGEAEVATPEPVKEPEEPAPQEQPPEPEAPKPEPGYVPIGAVLDERDRRKKLEAELEQMRQAQQPAEPFKMPDMFEDPDGYTAAINQQFGQRLYQSTLQMSERFARQQYGAETTDAAMQWAYAKCDADPMFNQQVRNSADPVGFAVQQFQRDQIVSNVTPDDFQQFMAWKQAQAAVAQPAPQQQAITPPARPPKSLATAPSAGNILTEAVQSEEEIFADTFARK